MTTEQALTIHQSVTLAQPGGFGVEGMEGLDQSDMIVPRYDIIQPTSRKEGSPGHFYLNLTGETAESILAVILRISRTRVLWSGNPAEKAPECSSADGVVGRTYGACNSCEFNPFINAGLAAELRAGKNLKACKLGYTYLCAKAGVPEELFLISMYGTSATPAKILNSQFLQKRRSPFMAEVMFKTKPEIGDKGKYFVHQPSIIRWLSPMEYNPYREMSRAMQSVAIREVEPTEPDEVVGDASSHGSISQEIAEARADIRAQDSAQPKGLDPEGQQLWEQLGGRSKGTERLPF